MSQRKIRYAMMASVKKTSSGEHENLVGYRKKQESFDETTLPKIQELKERVMRGSPSPAPFAPYVDPPATKQGPQMGQQWVITIHGTGAHHNHKPTDANRLAAAFVQQLREAGHMVTYAGIVHGNEDLVIDTERYIAEHNGGPEAPK